jgi:hypothetical protein
MPAGNAITWRMKAATGKSLAPRLSRSQFSQMLKPASA